MLDERAVDTIRVGPRARKDLGDLSTLIQSIDEIGLLHPVVIQPDGTLIAGERRLAAFRQLGRTTIPAHVIALDAVRQGERDENTARLDLAPSELVAIAEAVRPIEAARAQERERAGTVEGAGGRGRKKPTNPVETFHRVLDEKTRDRVAKGLGVSGRTLERARAVVRAAVTAPELYGPLVTEMDRTRRINGVYKKLCARQAAAVIRAEPLPLPTGPFRVIVADPPWMYTTRPDDASHRSASPYPPMSVDTICELPGVHGLAGTDAVLWLWATNSHLPDAFRVVEAWGFTYKTTLTWLKPRFGTGDWLRGQTEHCLLAVRGRPRVTLTNQSTALSAPAREHSRKPDAFYALVESLCPGSKVELFARESRTGWQTWGAERELFNAV